MPKSFCSGCKFWDWIETPFDGKFRYCKKLQEADIKRRRLRCNGEKWEKV